MTPGSSTVGAVRAKTLPGGDAVPYKCPVCPDAVGNRCRRCIKWLVRRITSDPGVVLVTAKGLLVVAAEPLAFVSIPSDKTVCSAALCVVPVGAEQGGAFPVSLCDLVPYQP